MINSYPPAKAGIENNPIFKGSIYCPLTLYKQIKEAR